MSVNIVTTYSVSELAGRGGLTIQNMWGTAIDDGQFRQFDDGGQERRGGPRHVHNTLAHWPNSLNWPKWPNSLLPLVACPLLLRRFGRAPTRAGFARHGGAGMEWLGSGLKLWVGFRLKGFPVEGLWMA